MSFYDITVPPHPSRHSLFPLSGEHASSGCTTGDAFADHDPLTSRTAAYDHMLDTGCMGIQGPARDESSEGLRPYDNRYPGLEEFEKENGTSVAQSERISGIEEDNDDTEREARSSSQDGSWVLLAAMQSTAPGPPKFGYDSPQLLSPNSEFDTYPFPPLSANMPLFPSWFTNVEPSTPSSAAPGTTTRGTKRARASDQHEDEDEPHEEDAPPTKRARTLEGKEITEPSPPSATNPGASTPIPNVVDGATPVAGTSNHATIAQESVGNASVDTAVDNGEAAGDAEGETSQTQEHPKRDRSTHLVMLKTTLRILRSPCPVAGCTVVFNPYKHDENKAHLATHYAHGALNSKQHVACVWTGCGKTISGKRMMLHVEKEHVGQPYVCSLGCGWATAQSKHHKQHDRRDCRLNQQNG